ncbi:MAG: HipA domain-containing protein [Campylobacterota bacterium]|nr:HipA domain-containing protein [Campylobacterota bacterium]
MNRCYGCLKDKRLKNGYCTKCIKELFDSIEPEPLDFDKSEFYVQRRKLAERMSISGVQDKISLKFEKNKLVATATEGKYILKPVPNSHQVEFEEDVVFNEHVSMLISKEIFKIDTASCAVIPFKDGELAYITKRFDNEEDGLKCDQEDFASVLDVNSSKDGKDYKYDAKTYLDCANAIKLHVPASVVVLEDFFKRLILNYLICNGDAHLKNFSLYSSSRNKDYTLSPNYDILNTRYHINEIYGDMALDLMDDFCETYYEVGFYTYDDFKKFAECLGIKEKRFHKILKLAKDSEPKIKELINKSFLSDKAKEFYIEKYSERLRRLNYNK